MPEFSPAVRRFLGNHPGFLPEHPLHAWQDAVHEEVDHRLRSQPGVITMQVNKPVRNLYSAKGPKRTRNLLSGCGVFNELRTKRKGGPVNADILASDSQARAVQELAHQTLRAGHSTVVLPFAGEKETIKRGIRYASGRVGPENVLAVDAGVKSKATRKAEKTGVRVINQGEVLKHVVWHRLRKERILPEWTGSPPTGHKGLTVYSSMLALASEDRLSREKVYLGDTDIKNPGPANGKMGRSGEYCWLDHLALLEAFLSPEEEVDGFYTLRTGEGRNNEPLTQEYNLIGYPFSPEARRIAEQDPQLQRMLMELAIALSTIGWPSTGERSFAPGVLEQIPVGTGMDNETVWNYNVAGMGVQKGQRNIVQVANPHPKIENRDSPRDREFNMITSFSALARSLASMVWQTGKFPHEWDTDLIGQFNHDHGGRIFGIFSPASHDHANNIGADVCIGFMLPSIRQLRQLDKDLGGVVDWESIKALMR